MSVPIDRLCRPYGRTLTRAPFLARPLDGTVWRCASDGHGLIALRVAPSLVAPGEPEDSTGSVAGWIALPQGDIVQMPLADLRAFAGKAVWDYQCGECGGTGKRPACDGCGATGRVTATCDDCDHEHTHDCPECDGDPAEGPCEDCAGTGRTRQRPEVCEEEVVGVAGCTLDVRLLAAVLACAPQDGGTVALVRDTLAQALVLRGDDWYGRVMEVRGIAPARRFVAEAPPYATDVSLRAGWRA